MTTAIPPPGALRDLHEAAPRRLQIETHDLDTAAVGLRGLLGDVSIEIEGAFEWNTHIIDFGPVTVTRGHYDVDVALGFAPPSHMLSVLTAGSGRATCGRESTPIGPGAALISAGCRAEWSTVGEAQTIAMLFKPSFLASELAALTGEIAKGPLLFEPSVRTDGGSGACIERICRFIASEIEAGTILDQPAVSAGLLNSLARALLLGQPHNHSHLLERPAPPASGRVVRRVEEYLDAHADQPIGAPDIVAVGGSNMRSIEAAFRSHRGTSPEQFLRSRRLALARRMLLEDMEISVPGAAHAAGYIRLDSFEADYVKAFKERPGETRRRALLTAAPRKPPAEQGPSIEPCRSPLSAREHEVCACVVKGMLNKQIAAHLGLSERTVKEYRANAMAKLGAGSAGELVSLFQQAGGR